MKTLKSKMKALGLGENHLIVTWKHPTSRQRYLIGVLSYENQTYCFSYFRDSDMRDVCAAIETGLFQPFPGLDDIYRSYQSTELFYPFAVRLPRRTDEELKRELNRKKFPHDDFHKLRITRGRMPTDDIEFLEPIKFNGHLTVEFEVAGWRYYDGPRCISQLAIGQELVLALEEDNEYDPYAIRIETKEGYMLGYVPAVYSRDLEEYVRRGEYRATIKELRPGQDPTIVCTVFVQAGMFGSE